MADIFDSLKKTWLRGMEAVSNTASSIAVNTKQKVNEMTLENRRREILSDFGMMAYDLWQKGETFPEPLANLLRELSTLDEELNALKAQRYTNVETEASAEPDESAVETEDAAPVMEMPEEEQEATAETPVPVMEIPEAKDQ